MAATRLGPARGVIAGVSLLALVAGVDYLYEHETALGAGGEPGAIEAPSADAAGSSLASGAPTGPAPTAASRARTTRAS